MKNYKINYYSAKELMTKARETIIPIESQFEAQEKLATVIAMHLSKIQAINRGVKAKEIASNSAFVVGSTGCGKTYLLNSLAEICGLSFENIDCASLTQSGIKGKNIGDCLSDIMNKNPNFFKNGGIILLDEADKTFYTGDKHYDSYSPQQDMLKLLEGGDYSYLVSNKGSVEIITVNLDKTLFLLAGACSGMKDQMKAKYAPKKSVGFQMDGICLNDNDESYMAKITLDDLIDYGMMPEIASRVNSIISVKNIDKNGYSLLVNDKANTSAKNKFSNLFANRGCELDISDLAVEKISDICVERNVGARSVQAVLNEVLSSAYNYLDDNHDFNKITLTTNNLGELKPVYSKGKRFKAPVLLPENMQFDLNITEQISSEKSINTFCDEFSSYSYLSEASYEPILYYYLQLACRYLASVIRPSERTVLSLIKLANATEGISTNPNHKTPFEIICEDYLEHLEKTSESDPVSLVVFSHYYHAFKSQIKPEYNHSVLTSAISTARKYYKTDYEIEKIQFNQH